MPRVPDGPGPYPRVYQKSTHDWAALKRARAEQHEERIAQLCRDNGWNREEVLVHISGTGDCYCACPDGPCEHEFTGPSVELEGGACISTTCWKCKMPSFYHDIRVMP